MTKDAAKKSLESEFFLNLVYKNLHITYKSRLKQLLIFIIRLYKNFQQLLGSYFKLIRLLLEILTL